MTHQSIELEVVIVRVGQHDVGQRGLGRHQAGGGGGGRGGLLRVIDNKTVYACAHICTSRVCSLGSVQIIYLVISHCSLHGGGQLGQGGRGGRGWLGWSVENTERLRGGGEGQP